MGITSSFVPARAVAPRGLAYRADIDGLRAIAVSLVVLFHAGFGGIAGGFVGVDVFFVISGFLITGIIVRELEAGTFSFADFYARRIRRICPALFVTLGVCTAAGFFLLVPEDLRSFGLSIVSAVLFISNMHFYARTGYFDGPAIEKPLLHTWSLAIEEQFYIIWPAALYVVAAVFGRRALVIFVSVSLCASLVAAEAVLGRDQAQAFYLLPYRMWELSLGALVAVAVLPRLSAKQATLLALAGAASIVLAAFAFTRETPFPGLHALAPCVGAGALIVAGSQPNFVSVSLLGWGPVRFVGRISYSLYLIHWPLFSFAHLAFDRPLEPFESVAIVAASVVLAILSYRYVETPARRVRLGLRPLAAMTASAGLALLAFGIVYHATNGLPARVPDGVRLAYEAKQFGGRGRDRVDCRGETPPTSAGTFCAIGAPAADRQYDFVIWGDSHARHLAAAFSDQAQARGLAGVIAYTVACPPLLEEARIPEPCRARNRQIAKWFEGQTRLKVVFLAAYWSSLAPSGVLSPPLQTELVSTSHSQGQGANVGLERTVQLLKSLGIKAVLVEDVPTFPYNISYCAARARMFGRSDARCLRFSRRDVEDRAARAVMLLDQASDRYGIPIVRTMGAFCEGDICRTEKDGVIFYIDADHLNTAGSRYLGEHLTIPWPSTGESKTASAPPSPSPAASVTDR